MLSNVAPATIRRRRWPIAASSRRSNASFRRSPVNGSGSGSGWLSQITSTKPATTSGAHHPIWTYARASTTTSAHSSAVMRPIWLNSSLASSRAGLPSRRSSVRAAIPVVTAVRTTAPADRRREDAGAPGVGGEEQAGDLRRERTEDRADDHDRMVREDPVPRLVLELAALDRRQERDQGARGRAAEDHRRADERQVERERAATRDAQHAEGPEEPEHEPQEQAAGGSREDRPGPDARVDRGPRRADDRREREQPDAEDDRGGGPGVQRDTVARDGVATAPARCAPADRSQERREGGEQPRTTRRLAVVPRQARGDRGHPVEVQGQDVHQGALPVYDRLEPDGGRVRRCCGRRPTSPLGPGAGPVRFGRRGRCRRWRRPPGRRPSFVPSGPPGSGTGLPRSSSTRTTRHSTL